MGAAFLEFRAWRCPTLTWGDPTLPSALNVFTSEFEMGSGGSRPLLPPGKPFEKKGAESFFKVLANQPLSREKKDSDPFFSE